MASLKDLLRTAPAWSAAVLTTTAIASMIQSWQVQSGLLDLGVKIPAGLALETAGRDFAGLLLPLLVIVLLHDIKAGERSAGRDILLLATTGGEGLWQRRAMVLALLLLCALLLPFWFGAVFSGAALSDSISTTVAVLLHTAFWSVVALRFARGDATAEVIACRLVGLWFVVAIALRSIKKDSL